MSSTKASTINKTAFSIKSAEETFTRAALYESFRKSEILHHVYLENVPTPVLREILNFEHSFIFRQLPVLGSKLAVKFGLEFLVSRFPRLQNYIQPSVLPIRLEDDERLALLEMIRAKPKPNLYVIVAKNISLNVLGVSISNIRDAITHSNLSSNELIDMFQLNKTNAAGSDESKKDSTSATDTAAETDTNGGRRKAKQNGSGASESENDELASMHLKRSAGDGAVTDDNDDDNAEPQQPIHTPPTVYSDVFSSSWQTPTPPLQRQSRSRSRSITPTQVSMPRERATSTTPVRLHHQTIDKSLREQLQRQQSMLPPSPPSAQNTGSFAQTQLSHVDRNNASHHINQQSLTVMQQRKAQKRHRYDSYSSNGSRRSRSISSSSSSVQSSREPTPIRNLPLPSSFQSPSYRNQQRSRLRKSQSPQWSDANSGDDDGNYARRNPVRPPSPKKQKSIEILNVEVIPAPTTNVSQQQQLLSPVTVPSSPPASSSALPKTLPSPKQSITVPATAAVTSNQDKESQQQKITNAHANGKLSEENLVISDDEVDDDDVDIDNNDLYADDIISGDEIKSQTAATNEKRNQQTKPATKLQNRPEPATKVDRLNDINTDEFYDDGDDDVDDVTVIVNGNGHTNSNGHATDNDVDDDDDDFNFDELPKTVQLNGAVTSNGNKRHSPSATNDSDLDVKRPKVEKVISVDTIQTTKFRNGSRLNGSNITYNDIISAVNGGKGDSKIQDTNGFGSATKQPVANTNEYNDIDDVDGYDDDDDLQIIENDEFNAMHKKVDALKKLNKSSTDKWDDGADNINSKLPSEIVKVDTVNFDDNYDDDDDELVYE